MSEFRMPSLGADMEDGTVVEWRVHPGDAVKRGDIVALVETEKGLIEIEIFENGVIDSIVVPAGNKVPVGTVLAMIRTADATPQRPTAQRGAAEPALSPPAPTPPVAAPPPPIPPAPAAPVAPRLHVSPLARKRAAELGVDLSAVHGSGAAAPISVEFVFGSCRV